MKVAKFDKDIFAALARLGFDIADDRESAEARCVVSIVQPADGTSFLIQIATPEGGPLVRTITRDRILHTEGADDDEDEAA